MNDLGIEEEFSSFGYVEVKIST